jgi:hypothetical protein
MSVIAWQRITTSEGCKYGCCSAVKVHYTANS